MRPKERKNGKGVWYHFGDGQPHVVDRPRQQVWVVLRQSLDPFQCLHRLRPVWSRQIFIIIILLSFSSDIQAALQGSAVLPVSGAELL